MDVRFTSPAALILVLGLAWFWYVGRGGSARLNVLRCAVVATLVLAIAGVQLRSRAAPIHVAFVVDRSASMSTADSALLGEVNRLAASMRTGDSAGLVVFGGEAAVERARADRLTVSRFTSITDRTGTNIEGALNAARSMLPADGSGRIVLLSDGRETEGRAATEALRAAADHVPVDVVRSRASSRPVNAVTRVRAPSVVRINEPFVITVTATGRAGTPGVIVLRGADGRRTERVAVFERDGVASASFDERSATPGVQTYGAYVRGVEDDLGVADESVDAGAVVVVAGEPHVLYVGASNATLERAIATAGFKLTHMPATRLPGSAAALTPYDAIVLDDVGAPLIGPAQSSALVQYVERSGGGLFVLGSPQSLTAAIPGDHPFRQLLPVDLRPRSGQRSPGAALVVVFDKSGSMDDRVGGIPKIELARQAILRAIDAMPSGDMVGVIAFDANPVPIAPLASSSDRRQVADRLGQIRPGGPTALAPALSLARTWLQRPELARVERRHVLLVSDGRTAPDDAAAAEAAVRKQGFELTAITVNGGGDSAFLTRLATSTGGRAYFPTDARELPFLLAREASRVAGGSTINESFVPRLLPHPIVAGLAANRLPRLGGYVVATARPTASVVFASHLDDPVLATWQYGLGRVAVYTAGVRSPWSADLRQWDGYPSLFVQATRWLSRRVRDGRLYARLDDAGGRTRITLEASSPSGGGIALLDARASVMDPSGQSSTVVLDESAPGHYEAFVPARAPGPYVVTMSATNAASGFDAQIVRGLYRSASRELAAPSDRGDAVLAELSTITGGRMLTGEQSPFTGPRPTAYVDVRPWLLAAAFAGFLVEILWPWGRTLIRGRSAGPRGRPHAEAA